jgi:atypical dual specificity phosphatase
MKVRGKADELRCAVDQWQDKRCRGPGALRLTTGFLDGTHPIVDIYELKARARGRTLCGRVQGF